MGRNKSLAVPRDLEECLLGALWIAAILGGRKLLGKQPEHWAAVVELYAELGYPPYPQTAHWTL